MTLNIPTQLVDSPDLAWRHVEEFVERIARLSKSGCSSSEFYGELLDGAVETLAAAGGAVWLIDESQDCACAADSYRPPLAATESFEAIQRQLASEVAAGSDLRAVTPGLLVGSRTHLSACDVLLGPVQFNGRVAAVLELFLPPDTSTAVRAAVLRVLDALAEAAADFHQSHALLLMRRRQADQARLDAFGLAVQESLDARATAFTIANDGRTLIGCDRMWVLAVRRSSCRVIAVSGCDEVDRGAESVRAMESLATAAATVSEPIWYFGETPESASILESRLHDYLDKSHARQIAVAPIFMPSPGNDALHDKGPAAVVAAESFSVNVGAEDFRRQMDAVCRLSSAALCHALRLQAIPGVSLLRRLGRPRARTGQRRTPYWMWILGGIVVLVAAAIFIPGDFVVTARGTLQPKLRRHIFAPRDAVVDKVFAAQGDVTDVDNALFQLRSPDLDYEYAKVVGELQAVQEQLRSVRAERVSGAATSSTDASSSGRLAASQESLEKRQAGLKRQQALLQAQQDALRIRSPISGQVLTWDVADQWQNRPVRQGQQLLEVADVTGSWILELEVADRDVRHVQAAQRVSDADLRVSFLLSTDLQTVYEGYVESVAVAAESRAEQPPAVRVTVRVADAKPTVLKAGASVVARIDCGQRSLGYVWLHDVIDAIRQYGWF